MLYLPLCKCGFQMLLLQCHREAASVTGAFVLVFGPAAFLLTAMLYLRKHIVKGNVTYLSSKVIPVPKLKMLMSMKTSCLYKLKALWRGFELVEFYGEWSMQEGSNFWRFFVAQYNGNFWGFAIWKLMKSLSFVGVLHLKGDLSRIAASIFILFVDAALINCLHPYNSRQSDFEEGMGSISNLTSLLMISIVTLNPNGAIDEYVILFIATTSTFINAGSSMVKSICGIWLLMYRLSDQTVMFLKFVYGKGTKASENITHSLRIQQIQKHEKTSVRLQVSTLVPRQLFNNPVKANHARRYDAVGKLGASLPKSVSIQHHFQKALALLASVDQKSVRLKLRTEDRLSSRPCHETDNDEEVEVHVEGADFGEDSETSLAPDIKTEQSSSGMLCHQCEDIAIQYCNDCSELLCADCTKHHRKSKFLRTHIMLTIAEFKEQERQKKISGLVQNFDGLTMSRDFVEGFLNEKDLDDTAEMDVLILTNTERHALEVIQSLTQDNLNQVLNSLCGIKSLAQITYIPDLQASFCTHVLPEWHAHPLPV
jgi:hypothetical protein